MTSSLLDRDFSPPSSFKDGAAADRWRVKSENSGNERWRSSNDAESGAVSSGGGNGNNGNERWSRRESGTDRTTSGQRHANSRERSPRKLRDRGGFA